MTSERTEKLNEIDMRIKHLMRDGTIEVAEEYGKEHNLSTETVLKNMSQYLDTRLDMQIEYNLTGWKGYDGIKISRDINNEDIHDVRRVLLAMSRLDGKVEPMYAKLYDAELSTRKSVEKLKEIKAMYRN